MEKPFFSVVVPTYNRKDFLQIAINSVLNQTFQDYELLIVDDGSTDETQKLILKITTATNVQKKIIRYFYQPHTGISKARNKGIKEARGKFVLFLDSDDRFCQAKMERTLVYINNYPSCNIFHTEEIWYKSGKILPQKKYHKKPTGFIFPSCLKRCCIGMSTSIITKKILEAVSGFDERLPACEDYDLWLKITAHHPVILIPEYLTIKQGGHLDQQSKRYPSMDKFRIFSLKNLLKSNTLNAYLYELAYKELKNKCAIYINGAKKRKKIAEIAYYQQLMKKFTNNSLCLKA